MNNIKLTIAYDGTHFAGWQTQKNAKTIQETIEKSLRKILKEKINLTGSGRTDSGVHAKAHIANFKTRKSIPPKRLQIALNANLPEGIVIRDAECVPLKFNSRFCAKSKVYRYTILNSKIDDPFLKKYYYKVSYRLNVALMRKEARFLQGRHDFKSFQAKSALSHIRNTKRTIKRIKIIKSGKFIYVDIEGEAFLHNMVRNIAGTLIEVGRGYLKPGSMKKILASRNRRKAGPTAPAKGLMLMEVKYEN